MRRSRLPRSAAVRAAVRELEALRPRTPGELHRFVRRVFGLDVPRAARIDGHAAPFDYLAWAFFEGAEDGPADAVVWANRGGGKTVLGAAATALDLLFKPGIEVRILAGSLEQTGRMFEHVAALLGRPGLRELQWSPPSATRVALVNGSRCGVLAPSDAAVRGQRVHKLRVDEVDVLDESIWAAAQLVTRSATLGGRRVRGSVEALSTMHRPHGPMSRLVERGHARAFKWNAIDVAERCPPRRNCSTCPIEADCRGRAKRGGGFVPIDDLIDQRRRLGDDRWASEMMCARPTTGGQVYRGFDPTPGGRHVMPAEAAPPRLAGDAQRPVGPPSVRDRARGCDAGRVSAIPAHHDAERGRCASPAKRVLVAGMDFGTRNPLVMVWALHWPAAGGDPRLGAIEVVDEHHAGDLYLDEHLRRIEAHGWPRPAWVGVDPAGAARNSQTGVSDIDVLRRRGYVVRRQASLVRDGIDRIRRRLDRGTLRIHPRCQRLIHALGAYRYDPTRPGLEAPVKDGPDHACDALRYLVINLELGPRAVTARGY